METEHRRLPSYRAGEITVPFVMASHEENLTRDVYFEEHSHPTHELLWRSDGAGIVVVGDHRWSVAPGLGMWLPAGVAHSGWAKAGTSTRSVHFSVDAVVAIADEPTAVQITPLLGLLLERLGDAAMSTRSRDLTEAMVLDLLRPAQRPLRVTVPRSRRLAPIVEAVLDDPGRAQSLGDWAVRLKVSARTLSRRFVEETGLGYAEWLRSARIQRAIPLLLASVPIEDVAQEVGYRSATAFGVAFRAETGTPPGVFRARYQREDPPVSEYLQNLS